MVEADAWTGRKGAGWGGTGWNGGDITNTPTTTRIALGISKSRLLYRHPKNITQSLDNRGSGWNQAQKSTKLFPTRILSFSLACARGMFHPIPPLHPFFLFSMRVLLGWNQGWNGVEPGWKRLRLTCGTDRSILSMRPDSDPAARCTMRRLADTTEIPERRAPFAG